MDVKVHLECYKNKINVKNWQKFCSQNELTLINMININVVHRAFDQIAEMYW